MKVPKKITSKNQLKAKITPKNKVKNQCGTWDSDFMKAAIKAVANNEANVTEALKMFSIRRQTLDDHIKNKFGKKKSAGQNTKLAPDKDQVLLNYCLFMAKSSYPL